MVKSCGNARSYAHTSLSTSYGRAPNSSTCSHACSTSYALADSDAVAGDSAWTT